MSRTPTAEEALVQGQAPSPWSDAAQRIEALESELPYWLATTAPDGSPHVRPILGLWLDGSFHFLISERSRKGRNLTADPRCALASSRTVPPSLDFVVEGVALRVDDEAALRRVIDAFGATMQWPLEIRDGGVFGPNAPTAGAPPYAIFRLTPRTIFGLPGIAGMEQEERPFSPTRWGFSGDS